MSYVRFQTGLRCRDTGRALGIFAAAARVEEKKAIQPWFEKPLKDTLGWFNKNLRVPKSDNIPWRCLFWFDCDSSEVIGYVWDLINCLEQHDVFVESRKCNDPGKIIYRDCHQVAAIPSQTTYRFLKLK